MEERGRLHCRRWSSEDQLASSQPCQRHKCLSAGTATEVCGGTTMGTLLKYVSWCLPSQLPQVFCSLRTPSNNSHYRFFNTFGPILQPSICVLFRVSRLHPVQFIICEALDISSGYRSTSLAKQWYVDRFFREVSH